MRLLVCDPVSQECVAAMREGGVIVDVCDDITTEQLERVIAGYDALVVRSRTRVTPALIDRAPSLRLIIRAGVGLDNVDVEYARAKRIEVRNTPSASSRAVAELTIGYLLAMARQIPQMTASMKSYEWDKGTFSRGIEIAGKTLGLIGCGRIGTLVARAALSLGMQVLFYCLEPYPNLRGARPVSLDELVARSDFISLHIPYCEETRCMMGKNQFARMKDGVYIINCGRGGTLDEKALYDAIVSGKVAGAALDVLEKEGERGWRKLMALPQVIGSPHVGGGTREARLRVGREIAQIATEFAHQYMSYAEVAGA
jgi:D-3-phosphoglycerate dehydrogenase